MKWALRSGAAIAVTALATGCAAIAGDAYPPVPDDAELHHHGAGSSVDRAGDAGVRDVTSHDSRRDGLVGDSSADSPDVCATCVLSCPGGATCVCTAGRCAATFGYTGSFLTFIVPAGIKSATIAAYGAAGGSGANGGSTTATIAVSAGESLVIYIGGQGSPAVGITGGAGGFNGGAAGGHASSGNAPGAGGGGASDVRVGGSALANRVVVAGGGGRGGGAGVVTLGGVGGAGGGATGGAGGGGVNGGGGGSQTAGGAGSGGFGTPGAPGAGGVGFSANRTFAAGGGGGGGYFGGGGGAYGGGGGGGSSFASASATGVTLLQGVQPGDGQVVITW